MNETKSVIQLIQLIIAPAVMINACGLLLLTINNKFTTVLNRIRALNDEKRRHMHIAGERALGPLENVRFNSISRQLQTLMKRAKMIRNAIFCFFISVALFVGSSLLIGFSIMIGAMELREVILSMFLIGMVSVLVGIVFASIDVFRGYKVVEFEVLADE
jgi:hypothetical protein